MSEFYPNDTNTAWIKNKFKTQDDFYFSSPYSPKGDKASDRIFKSELGEKYSKYRKKYYGDKSYIVDRIAFNKYLKSQHLDELKQKYDNVASANEAFKKGRHIKAAKLNGVSVNREEFSQVDDDSKINVGSNVAPIITRVNIVNPKKEFKSEETKQGLFTNYPGSNVYFKCPVKKSIDVNRATKEILKNKKYYCGGGELEKIIQYVMCYGTDEIIDPELKSLLEKIVLGSPGKCFQYGININNPTFTSYFF